MGTGPLEVLDAYIALERRVVALVRRECGPICAACSSPCCTPVMCGEVAASAWLRAVHARLRPNVDLRESGRPVFLSPLGCTLDAGRPILCLSFACEALRPGGEPGRRLARLFDTMDRVGRGAVRGRNLTDLLFDGDLEDVDPRVLLRRIRDAHCRLDQDFGPQTCLPGTAAEGTSQPTPGATSRPPRPGPHPETQEKHRSGA